MLKFDEMHAAAGDVREHYKVYDKWLARQPADVMKARREEAEMILRRHHLRRLRRQGRGRSRHRALDSL